MAQRFAAPTLQFLDASGNPLSGAKLNFYSTGTLSRKNTFSDSALTTANANPVVADSAGRFGDIFLESGTYRVILTDSSDVAIWDRDPVAGAAGSSGAVSEKTSSFTMTVDDVTKVFAVDASGGAVTATLLDAATAGDGAEITIKKTDSSANAVTIDGNGAETIDGATTFTLSAQYQYVTLRCDGSNWRIIAGAQIATGSLQNAAVTFAKVDSSVWGTGDVKLTLKATADTGWVLMDDGTIGNASSGGTTRANADTEALFKLLWDNISDTHAAVSGGRGASAQADFDADKTIALPKALGRALAVSGAGSGLTSRDLGETLGEEEHTLTTDELPSGMGSWEAMRAGDGTVVTGSSPSGMFSADNSGNSTTTAVSTGSTSAINRRKMTLGGNDDPANVMQPTSFLNVMIKL